MAVRHIAQNIHLLTATGSGMKFTFTSILK